MIKIAAILTTVSIACSGGGYAQQDYSSDCIASTRCDRPVVIVSNCPDYNINPQCTFNPDNSCKPDCTQDNNGCGTVDPDEPAVDPDEPAVDPDEPAVDPDEPAVDPDEPAVDPDEPAIDPGVTDPDPGVTDPGTGSETTISAYAQEVIRLVNIERQNEGLAPLKADELVSQAAYKRAQEIKTTFDHTRPDGTSCFTVLKEYGISYRAAGENIAKGSPTPERVVDGWMNSAGHRANILNENFTTIGVGYYVDSTGTAHWAQLFTA